MKMYAKFSRTAGAILVGIFVMSLACEVAAQNIPRLPWRNLRRSKLWTGLMNTGMHGPDRDGSRRASMEGVAYPGRNRLPGSLWDRRGWPGSNQWVQNYLLRTATARSLGTFIITRPDPSEYTPSRGKDLVVSFTSLTTSPDITPMAYPVSTEIEGQLGVGMDPQHPLKGIPIAEAKNWYPGQPHPGSDNIVEIHNWDFHTYMKPEHKRFGELVAIAKWTTEAGIQGTKKIYQWTFRDWDDFIIVENIFENTGDSDGDGVADLNGGAGLNLKDVYFAFYNYFWPTEGGTANRDRVDRARGYYYWLLRRQESENYDVIQDDVYRYTEAANYGTADPNHADVADAVGMKMSYAFDWDSPLTAHDDAGDPHQPENQCCWGRVNFQQRGELLAGQYVGAIPIDYTPPFVNDDYANYIPPKVAEQPFAVPWFTHKEEPDINRHSTDEIGIALVSVAKPGERVSMYNIAGRTGWPDNPTAPLPVQDNPTRRGETPEQPMSPNWHAFSHTYGPYDLQRGDRVKIVMAFTASMPIEENMWGWQRNIPQNQADLHTDKAMRNLMKHAQHAQAMYELGGDVPLPPPDIHTWIANTPAATAQISWQSIDDLEDPDYAGTAEAKDIAGYRIYRSDFYFDNWQLLKDIKVGDTSHKEGDRYSYTDDTSLAGFAYYYAVTAYDTGHSTWTSSDGTRTLSDLPPAAQQSVQSGLESGLSAPEQFFRYSWIPTSPAVAAYAEAERLEAKVSVVPNPFLADGSHAYEGSDKIRFVNLPSKCNVKIFSVSGDLMSEFDHDNPAVGEAEYIQLTKAVTGQVPAGVYFFVVKSLTPESNGKIQRGTFVVVGGSVR